MAFTLILSIIPYCRRIRPALCTAALRSLVAARLLVQHLTGSGPARGLGGRTGSAGPGPGAPRAPVLPGPLAVPW